MSTRQETILAVSGMSCRSCVAHINTALRGLQGVSNVDVRLAEGQVRVQHDAKHAPVSAMVEALRDAGYESKLAT